LRLQRLTLNTQFDRVPRLLLHVALKNIPAFFLFFITQSELIRLRFYLIYYNSILEIIQTYGFICCVLTDINLVAVTDASSSAIMDLFPQKKDVRKIKGMHS
jgi:hypothetical protein